MGVIGRDKLSVDRSAHSNFRAGQNVDFSWEFGTRREQLVGFTEPWLLDTPTSLSLRVYTKQPILRSQ